MSEPIQELQIFDAIWRHFQLLDIAQQNRLLVWLGSVAIDNAKKDMFDRKRKEIVVDNSEFTGCG